MASDKQHKIPCMHLRHFIDQNGFVWTYDALDNVRRPAIPDKTASEHHFYSYQMPDGTMNPAMDNHLTKIEGLAGPVYLNLLQGIMPRDADERAAFSAFLALMYFRTEAMRRMSTELYAKNLQIQAYAAATDDRAFNQQIEQFERDQGESVDPETKAKVRASMLDPSGYVFQVPKQTALIAMSSSTELAKVLSAMKWSVLEAEHHFFVTSDNPLMRRVARGTEHPFYGDGGFENRSAQVTFPLSPKRLLMLNWIKAANGIGRVTRQHVYEENEARAAHSERHLYAHIDHKDILKLAARHRHTRPDINISGLRPPNFASVTVPRKWQKGE